MEEIFTVKSRYSIFFLMSSLTLALISSTAIAMKYCSHQTNSVFSIKSKIFINGKLVSSPSIRANANQTSQFVTSNKNESENLRVNVIAKNSHVPGANAAISMKYDIQYQSADTKLHFKPKFILNPNQKGRIKMLARSGQVFEMCVLANRESNS